MESKKRLLLAFSPSWLLAFLLASFFHTLSVQNHLTEIGIEIQLADRLTMIMKDMLGLAPTYGVVIAIALMLGFTLINPVARRIPLVVPYKYVFAGGVSFALMLLAMEPLMNITVIAGARGSGFYLQCFAGVIGGWLFGYLLKQHSFH